MSSPSSLDFYDSELRAHHEHLRAAHRISPGEDVVDIGCGAGLTTREAGRAAAPGRVIGVDLSERIAGLLDEAGYAPVADGAQPDVVVFSTCAVRENADNTLDGNLGHLKPRLRTAPGMPPLDCFVVVCRSASAEMFAGGEVRLAASVAVGAAAS